MKRGVVENEKKGKAMGRRERESKREWSRGEEREKIVKARQGKVRRENKRGMP